MSDQGDYCGEGGSQGGSGGAGCCDGDHQDIHIKGRGCGRIVITELSPKSEGKRLTAEDLKEGDKKDVLGLVQGGVGRDVCGRFEEEGACKGRDICEVVEDAVTAFQRGEKVNIPVEISGDSAEGYRVRFRAEERTEVGVEVDGFAVKHARENAVVVTLKLPVEEPQNSQEMDPSTVPPSCSSSSSLISLPASTATVPASTSPSKDPTTPQDNPTFPCKAVCPPQVPHCPPQVYMPHHDHCHPHPCEPHHCAVPHHDCHFAPHYGERHEHHFMPHHVDRVCCDRRCEPHCCKPHCEGCCGPRQEQEQQQKPRRSRRQDKRQ